MIRKHIKASCEPCINGHRANLCNHYSNLNPSDSNYNESNAYLEVIPKNGRSNNETPDETEDFKLTTQDFSSLLNSNNYKYILTEANLSPTLNDLCPNSDNFSYECTYPCCRKKSKDLYIDEETAIIYKVLKDCAFTSIEEVGTLVSYKDLPAEFLDEDINNDFDDELSSAPAFPNPININPDPQPINNPLPQPQPINNNINSLNQLSPEDVLGSMNFQPLYLTHSIKNTLLRSMSKNQQQIVPKTNNDVNNEDTTWFEHDDDYSDYSFESYESYESDESDIEIDNEHDEHNEHRETIEGDKKIEDNVEVIVIDDDDDVFEVIVIDDEEDDDEDKECAIKDNENTKSNNLDINHFRSNEVLPSYDDWVYERRCQGTDELFIFDGQSENLDYANFQSYRPCSLDENVSYDYDELNE
ncbi:hypothetical protein BN7_2372 [Wickerhamomyces ciferrii]|uniref:Copper-fist domain-containing protein n=1 Tax=Wickerhamomyces ciferrii (strain ATCC 14091 / BCRC 22168 / CBS 111 / JCM 3599 / NBRC 0793 / NRRL Y-1031 F-60-10) TaxID=1206466 RepID=K0KKZ7_WICCF|nr:uncharacterized protein BN7_2372 [Wickerhamomyces ciferrii]CCH42827.1 hypothetical protein BN7_2372 [Wickerhamomyces ciferrii]